MCLCNCT